MARYGWGAAKRRGRFNHRNKLCGRERARFKLVATPINLIRKLIVKESGGIQRRTLGYLFAIRPNIIVGSVMDEYHKAKFALILDHKS